MAFGYVTYPGVQSVLNFEFTDSAGLSPSRAYLDIMPQDEVPLLDGDLDIYYFDDSNGSYHITIKDMHLDSANYQRDSGGKVVRLNLMDERWRWGFGEISGRYNFRQAKCYDAAFAEGAAVDFVDPDHEKNPQEMAELLIEAMGYSDSDWDYSILPTEPRPNVDWDHTNPAQELARLADQFGCRIVPVRSDGSWAIVKLGEGADLPDQWPYQDPGDGIDPVEAPDYLKIVTAPILYEARLPLEAVGKDYDTLFYPLSELSYCPNGGSFIYSDPEFWDIDNTREILPDESLVSPQELAQQTIYKCFKLQGASLALQGAEHDFVIPGISDPVDVQRIIITEDRVVSQISNGSTSVVPLHAFIEGTFWDDRKSADSGNYPLGTRLDISLLSQKYMDDDDVSYSFSLSNSEDVRHSLISFNAQVTSWAMVPNPAGGANIESFMNPPTLYLHTAVKIRDAGTWQAMRDERYRYIGTGPEPTDGPDSNGVFIKTIIKNDIQPWYRGRYTTDGTLVDTLDNHELVTKQCDAYLDDLEQIYEVVNNERRRYIGLYPIDLDGKIQQVSYHIGSQGQDTIASKNTEHDFELPTYDDRRAREARKNPENREARAEEIREELRQKGIVI